MAGCNYMCLLTTGFTFKMSLYTASQVNKKLYVILSMSKKLDGCNSVVSINSEKTNTQ